MNRKGKMKIVFICAALVLALVILYSGLQILESTVLFPGQNSGTTDTKWIVRDGVRYYPRQDIVVVLIMGTDHEGVITGGEADRGHTADMIALLIFDEKAQTGELLLLNRDTMVMMSSLNEYGKEDGTYYAQLALSYNFGTGREDSCENTKKSVSKLLGGITIDHYFAMNMDAIALLNDAVGGVAVTVTEDFSAVDPSIEMGEVTLNGQQAMNFVRSRKYVGSQLNLSRMERQKEYMKGFVAALHTKLGQGNASVLQIYEEVSPYMVTDCSGTVMKQMLEDYGSYSLGEVLSPAGENVLGEEHYEFYVDEEALDELILRLFYAPK